MSLLPGLLAKFAPWLTGLGAAIAVIFGSRFSGARSAKADARAKRAEESLQTRNRIDKATEDAPTDPDAARDALRKRLRDKS